MRRVLWSALSSRNSSCMNLNKWSSSSSKAKRNMDLHCLKLISPVRVSRTQAWNMLIILLFKKIKKINKLIVNYLCLWTENSIIIIILKFSIFWVTQNQNYSLLNLIQISPDTMLYISTHTLVILCGLILCNKKISNQRKLLLYLISVRHHISYVSKDWND